MDVGGKKMLVQQGANGEIKRIGEDKSTTVVVSPGGERKELRKDMQQGTSLRKEFNNLPDVKEANQVVPKITAMEKAYAESKL